MIPGILVIILYGLTILFYFASWDAFVIWISCLTLYQLTLIGNMGWYSHIGYAKVQAYERTHWKEDYKANKNEDCMDWDDITIYVIFPNYKEDLSILRDTLNAIKISSVAKSHLVPVLAMEARETEHAEKAEELISEYISEFKDMTYTAHPPGIEGERPGKSSNENYAARQLYKHIKEKGYDEDNVLITIADADSIIHEKYFECILNKFCLSPERYRTTWQAPMVNFLNIWKIPVFSRIMSYTVTAEVMASLANPNSENLPFSTYTIAYKTAKEVNFWDPEVCAEDWHMYLKTCFYMGDNYKCEPVFLPVHCYSVGESTEGYMAGMRDRFDQGMRHCLAVHEVVFLLKDFVEKTFMINDRSYSFRKWIRLFYVTLYPLAYGAIAIFVNTINIVFFGGIGIYLYFNPESDTAREISTSVWYYLLSALNFLCGLSTGSMLYFIAKILTKKDENKGKWYLYSKRIRIWIRLLIEFSIFVPFASVLYAFIPTVANVFKTMRTLDFEYITATKTAGEGEKKKGIDVQNQKQDTKGIEKVKV